MKPIHAVLIAVGFAAARAALALLPILEEHLFERGPEEEALRAALEELK